MKKIYSKPTLLSETVMLEQIIALSKSDDPASGEGLVKERDVFPNDEDRAIMQVQIDKEEGNAYDLW